MPRLALIAFIAVWFLFLSEPAWALDKVKVGVLKLTSSAPIFLGVERGLFKEYGVEPELVQKDGRFQPGAQYDEVVAITARYTGSTPDIVRRGFPYQDRNGRLWVDDVGRQMAWWHRHGFMKAAIPVKDIVDTTFLDAAIRAVKD